MQSHPFKFDIEPVRYFKPSVCGHLYRLSETSIQLWESMIDQWHELPDDTLRQLIRSDKWEPFAEAAEEFESFWLYVRPSNMPYDFGWCKASLGLFEKAETLVTCSRPVNENELHIEDICIISRSVDKTTELLAQFENLRFDVTSTSAALRNAFQGKSIPCSKTFEP